MDWHLAKFGCMGCVQRAEPEYPFTVWHYTDMPRAAVPARAAVP
jgi:hypothetical protein